MSTAGIVDAVDISAGHAFACAVRATGSVVCWGRYTHGELGNGTVAGGAAPTEVTGITDAVEVEVSASHVCARRRNGQAACWGDNRWGQLGDGTTTNRTTPVAVSGISTAVAIDVAGLGTAGAHSCAVRADGTVVCWGSNSTRQLGDGSTTQRTAPVVVSSVSGAVDITLGDSNPTLDQGFSMVRLRDQRVLCWGANGSAQCGQGSTSTTVSSPTEVTGFRADVLEVSAGSCRTTITSPQGRRVHDPVLRG
jgi:alpha-tubulin suppressor-like RCC1 family protein